ncbi:MAG: DNA methyltransferase [Chitinophagales bacterium]
MSGLKAKFNLPAYLKSFTYPETGSKTKVDYITINGQKIARFTNEYWTAKQRKANALHEISYRACFKPQLPRFFIEALTQKGDTVFDPFNGRGTTIIEAALLGRNVIANDVNPLSIMLSRPRLNVPTLEEIEKRLLKIPLDKKAKADIDLSMFYHRDTEAELVSLKNYLLRKKKPDHIDEWIRMVATNRLTGHSKNFFSGYTLPPNQAITAEKQRQINKERKQKPPYKNVKAIILKKSKDLLKHLTEGEAENLKKVSSNSKFLNTGANSINEIKDKSVKLTVTSPPFLNVVQYAKDNWLRCWFNGIDVKKVEKKITMSSTVEEWNNYMSGVFKQLHRITAKNGYVAFEVGEVRNGKIKLDEAIVPVGKAAGFQCEGILINAQNFTKTANIWGINNNSKGTNTNRIVLFKKQ